MVVEEILHSIQSRKQYQTNTKVSYDRREYIKRILEKCDQSALGYKVYHKPIGKDNLVDPEESSDDITKVVKKDNLRQYGISDPIFNRINCEFNFEEGDSFLFFPIQCEYHHFCHPLGPKNVSGFITQIGITETGKKIMLTKVSEGINKTHIVFRNPLDKDQLELDCGRAALEAVKDIKDDGEKSQMFKEKFEYHRNILVKKYFAEQYQRLAIKVRKQFDITLLPKYNPKPAKIVNRGYENKAPKDGIEIYFNSGKDLGYFLRHADELEDYEFQMPPGSKMDAYMMRTFIMPLFTWQRVENWKRISPYHTITNLDVEVLAKISDCHLLEESEQLKHPAQLIVTSLDIEMLNKMIRISDVRELMENPENIITNVVMHSYVVTLPASFSHLQSINIVLGPQNGDAGFFQDDVPVKNIFVNDERRLIETWSMVMNRLRPDMILGHNSLRFDFPILALAQARVNKSKLFNQVSCMKLGLTGIKKYVDASDYDTFNISQGTTLLATKMNIPGILCMDTMLICLAYFRMKKTLVSLDKCAANLKLPLKHGMSYQTLKLIYELVIDYIDREMNENTLRDRIVDVISTVKDEMVFSTKLGELREVIEKIDDDMNKNRITPKIALDALVELSYKYCSQDTMIVHKIVEVINFLSNHIVFCRATCLSSKYVMENKMYTVINQFKGVLGNVHGCISTHKKAIDHEVNLVGCTKTWGAVMLVNYSSKLATNKIMFAFDFESAYPNTMIAGISPDNCLFSEPTEPGLYLNFTIPSDDVSRVIPVWFRVGESFLGNISKTLVDLRAEFKKKMKAVDGIDNMLYQQYDSVQGAAKILSVSLYGITTHGTKESIYNWATSNATTMHTGWCLALCMSILRDEGFITSCDKIVYSHTDSEMFEPNLQPYFDDPIPTDPIEYHKFVCENINKIREIGNSMCAIVNERVKSLYSGYTTMRMSLDAILYGAMFFEQGKYSYVNIQSKLTDTIEIGNVTYKKLKCTDQSTTPLVRELVQSVIVALLNHLRTEESSPETLLETMLSQIKLFIEEFDFNNMQNFVSVKKYKSGVTTGQIADVVMRHNQTVSALQLDVPYIYPGQQVNIIHIKKKHGWRFNGSVHNATSSASAITLALFDPDIHEIDMEYYLRSSKADLLSISRSFGFSDEKATKNLNKSLNEIFDRSKEPPVAKKAFFEKWWPAFDSLFKHDEYLGLSKYVCLDGRKLREYVLSYLYKIEELVNKTNPKLDHEKCSALFDIVNSADLNNKYNKTFDELVDIIEGELGVVYTKIYHLFLMKIDELYLTENPWDLFDSVRKVLDENEHVLIKANNCAKKFSIMRYLKKIKKADLQKLLIDQILLQ